MEQNNSDLMEATESAVAADISLPNHSRKRAAFFTLLVILSIFVNIACGVLNYSFNSGGRVLGDLYDYLASRDLSFFVWVAAGVGLLGTVTTVASYVLSFDYRRPGRPLIRLWILFVSFGLFITGLLLGLFDVRPDNVPVILGAGVLCLLLPVPVVVLERMVGRGSLRSAVRLLERGSVGPARASAHSALVFLPGKAEALVVYGRALSAAGRHDQALPYLVYAERESGDVDARAALALADAWEAAGNSEKTIHYLEMAQGEAADRVIGDRLVRLWLDGGREDDALRAMLAMEAEQQRPWREDLLGLLSKRRDRENLHRLCGVILSEEGEPFEQATACYKNILGLFPTDGQALEELIGIQKKLNERDTVAALQEELLNLDENDIALRRELVEYYWEKGFHEDLLRHLNRIMLSGKASTAEKLRLLEETYAQGDFLSVEQLVTREHDLTNNPRALFILATTLAEAGREEEALERLTQARRIGVEDERLLKNVDALAARIRKTQLDKGLTTLEKRVTHAPGDLDLKFEYLDHLVAARSADRVVVQLEDLLEREPDLQDRVEKEIRVMLSRHGKNRRLMDYLADLYLRRREYDLAFELYQRRAQGEMDAEVVMHEAAQRILSLNPNHVASLEAQMRYYHDAGDGAEALAYLDRLPAEHSARQEQRRLEMDAAEKVGNFSRAIEAGLSLLEHSPEDTELLSRVAGLYGEGKDFPSAIELLKRASKIDPESFEIRRQLRGTVETMKRDRMEEIKGLLKDRPGDRDLLEELGDIHHDFEQLNEAIKYYQRAGLNDPERRIPRAKLGYLLARKGLFTDADEALAEADLNPSLAEEEQEVLKNLFFTIAQLMEEEAEAERALNLYRRIFRVDAGYEDVVSHIERLQASEKKKRNSTEY